MIWPYITSVLPRLRHRDTRVSTALNFRGHLQNLWDISFFPEMFYCAWYTVYMTWHFCLYHILSTIDLETSSPFWRYLWRGDLDDSDVLVHVWSKFSVPEEEGALLGPWSDIGSSLSPFDLPKKLRIARAIFFGELDAIFCLLTRQNNWSLRGAGNMNLTLKAPRKNASEK